MPGGRGGGKGEGEAYRMRMWKRILYCKVRYWSGLISLFPWIYGLGRRLLWYTGEQVINMGKGTTGRMNLFYIPWRWSHE